MRLLVLFQQPHIQPLRALRQQPHALAGLRAGRVDDFASYFKNLPTVVRLRVATTGSTWLGLTIGCAQCHTHKYDPIQHTEYYQFMAFMNNADEPKLEVPDAKITEKRREAEAKIAKETDAAKSTKLAKKPVITQA